MKVEIQERRFDATEEGRAEMREWEAEVIAGGGVLTGCFTHPSPETGNWFNFAGYYYPSTDKPSAFDRTHPMGPE